MLVRNNQGREQAWAMSITIEERLMKFWLSGNRVRIPVFIVSILLVCSGSVFAQAQAQTQTGRLRGQIVDATGAVIPGASITVKNSSGLVVSATSDGVGSYDVKNLAPGKYTVSVMAKGFAPATQEMEIAAGQVKQIDIPLAIVVKEEDIDVQSDAARVRFLTIPMNCNRNFRRSPGLPPAPMADRFILTASPAVSFLQSLPYGKSASTRIRFPRSMTAWVLVGLKFSPSPALTKCTASSFSMITTRSSMG
jgi:hypothetical protein